MIWLKRRLYMAAVLLVIIGVKYWWHEHDRRQEAEQQADAFTAEMGDMSADRIVDSDWAYSGPLGSLALRFERDGKLSATSGAATSEGHWEIRQKMLLAYIPGAEKPHAAIFRGSTDLLSGVSPDGMTPSTWTATRSK